MSLWISTLLFVILVGLCSYIFLIKDKEKSLRLPPGPLGLPILGNLHMLGDLPHRDLHQLAKKFGPIMHLKLGLIPTIVVSSPEAAKLFLKTHDPVFASRPRIQAAEYISYGQKGLAFSDYGPYWRNMRKLCTLELLTSSKIELFKPMRRDEMSSLVEEIKVAGEAREVVDLSAKVETLIEDITYRMIFGSKGDRFKFKASIHEALRLAAAFNLSDFVPFLRPLDLQGLGRLIKTVSKDLDELLEKIIDEHMHDARYQSVHNHHRDFIDIMLSLKDSNNAHDVHLDLDRIKAIIIDMLAGAMDTSAIAILWVFSELMRHPSVMKQAQNEVRNLVGMDRMVEETDLAKLEYLNMVIKESMRLHPVATLTHRECNEDVVINGYNIPKKSRLVVNIWGIGHDPDVWSDNVEEFNPSRFAHCDIDVYGRDFQLIPFGSGRRCCPGIQMGLTVVRLVLAQLLHCFDWELPSGVSPCDLDMSENFSLAS